MLLRILFYFLILFFSLANSNFAEINPILSTSPTKKDESTLNTKTNIEKTDLIENNKNNKDSKDAVLNVKPKYETLMFTTIEYEQIMKILNALEKGIDISTLEQEKENKTVIDNNKVSNANSTEKKLIFDENMATVYLNSILFISEERWAVWANNVKITNETNGDGELRILSINANEVKFLWTISMSKWEVINSSYSVSEDLYSINKDNQVEIQFILKPNQIFVPSLNKILEGNLKSNQSLSKKTENIEDGNKIINSNEGTEEINENAFGDFDKMFFGE